MKIFSILFVGIFGVLTLNAYSQEMTSARLSEIERERTPQIEKLYELVRSADRIVVRADPEKAPRTLFDSSKTRDLLEFQEVLKVTAPDDWRLSVCADPYVILYKNGKEIVSIGNVGGREVKTSVWSGNAIIADTEKWLKWFDARGMPQLRKERDDATLAEAKYERDLARWNAAMPRGIKDAAEKQMNFFGLPSMNNTVPFGPILEREYPDKKVRILAVLHWYGSGEGPWSGYPAHETIAENILFMFSTSEILEALKSRQLSVTETEGAARLFAGWDYHEKRPDDLKLIPKEIRSQLLAHAMKSGDKDKRSRAKAAFASQ